MKIATLEVLSLFLSKLRTIFSSISHTHTVADTDGLENTLNTMQNDVEALDGTVANLAMEINNKILPPVTSENEGNFLRVVDGTWKSVSIPIAEEASF